MDTRGWVVVKESLSKLLDFQDDEVYVLIAFARKKNNPLIGHTAHDAKKPAIFREVLTKEDWVRQARRLFCLMKNYSSDDGIVTSEHFNLYLVLNPRNPRKALMSLKVHMAEWEYHQDYTKLQRFSNQWFSCLQKKTARSRRLRYLIDIDKDDVQLRDHIAELFENPLLFDSRNGYHIVVPPFDLKKFYEQIGDDKQYVEVKTDDCVNLWCGNWIS